MVWLQEVWQHEDPLDPVVSISAVFLGNICERDVWQNVSHPQNGFYLDFFSVVVH